VRMSDRDRKFFSRRCSAIPLQSMGAFLDRQYGEALSPKMAETAKYLSGKPSAIPLFVERKF